MRSLCFPCKALIFFNYVSYLSSAEATHSIPISLVPPPLHYSPNLLSVLSNPICPASAFPPNEYDFSPPKSKYHPWDEEPTCLRIINLTGEHTYCIHSSTSFTNGRGISILTTPEVASSIANSSAFSPSNLIANGPTSSPFQTGASPSFPPPFEVKEIPGRGKGLVANKTINFGDVISYNTPLLIVDREFFDSDGGLEKEQRFALLRDTVSKLPQPSQGLFFEQCTRESGIVPVIGQPLTEGEVEDIMKTNSYTGYFTPSSVDATREEKVTHGLNIPESSRLNHDCRPNTHFTFDTETLTHKIHAVTTIQPGEEITTSYTAELEPYQTRQTKLLKHWGFHCSCSLCSSTESQRTQSDSRLSLLKTYRSYLMDWSYESLGTPELALKYLSLILQENLHAKLGEAYTITAMRFNAWEKEHEARRYAGMAVEKGLWWDREEAFDLEEMKKLMVEGRKHWSWGLGRKLRIGQDGTAPVEGNVAHAGMRLVKQQVIR